MLIGPKSSLIAGAVYEHIKLLADKIVVVRASDTNDVDVSSCTRFLDLRPDEPITT
jgi:hypothetical protein